MAAKSFAAVRTVFLDADDHTAYSRDIISEIFEAGDEVDASAIAYQPRSGNRIKRLFSGDLSLKLVTNANRPVIALPQLDSNQ